MTLVELRTIETEKCFRLAGNWADGDVWMVVVPIGTDGNSNSAPYGITYQPTGDGNSVYAVNLRNGKLARMLARLPCVLEPNVTIQLRIDRTDPNYFGPY